ncbi:MAG TPA: glucose 1-dehydrogenase [Candidatus Binatia bacterium]|jgi:NAD(P)-dependent dehydrogenase (short-subunit alcohol dehydrogenase family)|nr:glucose 1-dehydrogenase [Candidatus Binatia bacterium]
MGRLEGKVVIITGAARGQGAVAAELFAKEGARLFLSDILPEGERVAAQITAQGGQALFMQADVSQESDAHQIAEQALAAFGRIDVLYNNAGIILGKPFQETTLAEWEQILRVDLTGPFLMSTAVVPSLIEQQSGSIINISSAGGILGYPSMAAYGAAKGGLVNLTRCMAVDLAPYNIRVNAICPGAIDTPMPRKYLENVPNKEAAWQQLAGTHLLKRFGTPAEVVYLALFLASDEASFMTGAVIPVDGGLSAY